MRTQFIAAHWPISYRLVKLLNLILIYRATQHAREALRGEHFIIMTVCIITATDKLKRECSNWNAEISMDLGGGGGGALFSVGF